MRNDGYVYFIEAPEVGAVKIGYSEEPLRRLTELQPHSPVLLRLVFAVKGTYADERSLHERFAGWRIRGEWYSTTSRDLRMILSLEGLVTTPLGRLFTREALAELVASYSLREVAA